MSPFACLPARPTHPGQGRL